MGLRRKSNWDLTKPVFNRKDLERDSMIHAVECGDVDSLQRLIDSDIKQCITLADSVNTADGLLSATPLHAAAENGELRVAKFLLMNGRKPTAAFSFGLSRWLTSHVVIVVVLRSLRLELIFLRPFSPAQRPTFWPRTSTATSPFIWRACAATPT